LKRDLTFAQCAKNKSSRASYVLLKNAKSIQKEPELTFSEPSEIFWDAFPVRDLAEKKIRSCQHAPV
jgi:hypothetical protein